MCRGNERNIIFKTKLNVPVMKMQLNLKTKFPITFTSSPKLLGRVGEVRSPLDPSPTMARYSTAFFNFKNSKFHHQERLGPISRDVSRSSETQNQEKGVLAKGVSAESNVTPKETKKYPRTLGPAAHLAPRAPLPRAASIVSKTPF